MPAFICEGKERERPTSWRGDCHASWSKWDSMLPPTSTGQRADGCGKRATPMACCPHPAGCSCSPCELRYERQLVHTRLAR